MATVIVPNWRYFAAKVLAFYGALILFFLGGARWGVAIIHPNPPRQVVSLAMLPTLIGLLMLQLPSDI